MNKQDFRDWQRHPVTQIVFSELRAKESDITEKLVISTENAYSDDWYRGYIAALRDFYLIDIEESQLND